MLVKPLVEVYNRGDIMGLGFFSRIELMISDRHDKQIGSFRFKLGCLLALRECVLWSFAWIMIWAVGVVVARAGWAVEQSILLWGALGLVIAVAVGIYRAVGQLPRPDAVRALLDGHGRHGGLLMSAGDADIGQWSDRIRAVSLPSLRWRMERPAVLAVMSVAFLAAAFLAPDRALRSLTPGRNDELQIGGEMKKLSEKLKILKQERIIAPEKADALEKNLAQVREDARSNDPAKTMEAMDHLEHTFKHEAREAAESAIKQAGAAERMEKLASALQSAESRMDSKQFAEAMKELAEMTEKAAAENEMLEQMLDEGLGGEFDNADWQNNLSPEQLDALQRIMQECKDCQFGQIDRLIDGELIDGEWLRGCEGGGEFDEDALLEALLLCKDGDELGDLLALLNCGGCPGRGGISRGRGDAAMSWRNGTEKNGATFKEKALPPAALSSLKGSKLSGISIGNPTAKKSSGGSAGGALGGARAGGGEAHSQIILPEHKKTVKRYFDREKK